MKTGIPQSRDRDPEKLADSIDQIQPEKNRKSGSMARGKEKWEPPPQGFIKLNYDGASKGNPGQAGAGGLFRDS
jgi:hypothetical protein